MRVIVSISSNTMNKLLVVLLIAIPQLAMGAIGTISDQFQDPARITRKDITLDGVKGVGVEMKDQLRTGAGTLEITFDDDTQVQMTESAKLTIDDFVYDPKNKDAGKLAIKIASGTARYASGQIAKNRPQAVKIRTPSATVSVRGTEERTFERSVVGIFRGAQTEPRRGSGGEGDEQGTAAGKVPHIGSS